MNKVSKSALRVTTAGIIGTVASTAIGTAVSNAVYKATESYDKSLAAGALVGTAGMTATLAAMVTISERDQESFTEEDFKKANRINKVFDSVTSTLKAASNVLRVASMLP